MCKHSTDCGITASELHLLQQWGQWGARFCFQILLNIVLHSAETQLGSLCQVWLIRGSLPCPLMLREIELLVIYIFEVEQHCCFPAECFRTKTIPGALPVCMNHLVGKINRLPKTRQSQQLASKMHLSVSL